MGIKKKKKNANLNQGHLGMISPNLTMIPVREDSAVVIIYPDICLTPKESMSKQSQGKFHDTPLLEYPSG